MTGPRTATATEHPCELHLTHSPVVVRTQGHHRHPLYLQHRLWGEKRDDELLWLCGNDHDAVHEMIGWLLGESRRPDPMPGWKTRAEAQRTVAWFHANST